MAINLIWGHSPFLHREAEMICCLCMHVCKKPPNNKQTKKPSSVAHFRVEVVYNTVSTLVGILGIQL